ncbi:MAG: 16S rRNA (guanine(966)-N(2))-methyltransferase RsmD [Candidatus Aminicenantes bacterium]|nr:16S rRNA (guanine(966)-N(2))-methyltransferase RsmD [Candidatus Aminicenantes bacterium]
MIRIISGKYKGKRLKLVRSPKVRPMPHKLRETLFNIIQFEVPDIVIMDGFAGTGSVGLEAFSRGAKEVCFVDDFYPAIKAIKTNIRRCRAEDSTRVIHKDFNRAVIKLSKEEKKFDLIFLDPPYVMLKERDPLKVIYKREVLSRGGIIVLRRHFKVNFKSKYFEMRRTERVAEDVIEFYGYEETPDQDQTEEK